MGTLARCFAAVLAAAALAPAAGAHEVGAVAPASGFIIHDATETLSEWCSTDPSGRVWLEAPGGLRFELVPEVDDPAIPNPGDGAFHPYSRSEVEAALAGVRYPLEGVAAHVFLLPFPRRHGLESAAGPGLILLAPGVRPIAREHQHAEFVHELGHVVQYARMPDTDGESWSRYRRLRGIEDSGFAASSPHADRPHEIFAEDFRYLFGGAWANTTGSIENAALVLPDAVAGLEVFLRSLAVPVSPPIALRAAPNPARGAIEFVRDGAVDRPLDIFDAAGRRVATVAAEPQAGVTRWHWDGRDARGHAPRVGAHFARVRGNTGPAARVTLLP